jgi:predicted transcriptional regulator
MTTSISSMMQRQVWTAGIDDNIDAVEVLLAEKDLSWVPVVGEGGVVGVISTSDLLQFHAQQRDAQNVRAWQLCSYKPAIVDADASVLDVARLMVQRNVHHVVVTQRGEIQGVVSSLDFVRRFVADEEKRP